MDYGIIGLKVKADIPNIFGLPQQLKAELTIIAMNYMHTVWIYHLQFYSKFWPIQEMNMNFEIDGKKTPTQMVNADYVHVHVKMYTPTIWMKCCRRQANEQGGISSSVLSVFFTDKFALSQSDARISVAYNICQWKTLTKRLMKLKCPPGLQKLKSFNLQQTKIHCTNEAPSNINELLDIYQAMH